MALQERTRAGVVVDVCSRCRGVWLDRGEMEKLVAEPHTYEREKVSRHAEPSVVGARNFRSHQRASTWARLMQLFESDR